MGLDSGAVEQREKQIPPLRCGMTTKKTTARQLNKQQQSTKERRQRNQMSNSKQKRSRNVGKT
jgi:hypothetical protein